MLSIFCLPEDLHNTKSYVSCAIVKPFFSFSLPNYDDEPRIFAIFLSSNEMIYLLAHRDITHAHCAQTHPFTFNRKHCVRLRALIGLEHQTAQIGTDFR